MAYRLPGSAAYEQVERLNSLDQLSPPAADLNLNAKRIYNIGKSAFNTDAAQAFGSLLAYTHQYGTAMTYGTSAGTTTATAGSATWTTTASSTTLAALSSTYVTVGPFTAISTQVLVQISAAYGAWSGGTIQLIMALLNHTGGAQVGYHTNVRMVGSAAAISEDFAPLYAEILVTGLTIGNSYQYDLAWAQATSNSATFTLSTGGATSGAAATTDFGALTMKVFSA